MAEKEVKDEENFRIQKNLSLKKDLQFHKKKVEELKKENAVLIN